MSREILNGLVGGFDRGMGFTKQFIETCPDEIWEQNFGGWPLWQQVFHILGCIPFFANKDIGDVSAEDVALCKLEVIGTKVKSKQEMLGMLGFMEGVAAEFFASLDDKKLVEICEPFKQKTGREVNYAGLVALMGSHTMYHFGTCDAALRQAGLKGIF